MDACIKYLPEFERRAKALAKKYKSFVKDYDAFLDSLKKTRSKALRLGRASIKSGWQLLLKGKGRAVGIAS